MDATGQMEVETNFTKLRIRVAELCGKRMTSVPPTWFDQHSLPIPDYPNDLNAMHEAESTLSFSNRQRYYHKLRELHPATTAGFQIADIGLVRSSALARAKAFVVIFDAPSVLEPNENQ